MLAASLVGLPVQGATARPLVVHGLERISGRDPFRLGCGVPGVQPGAETGPAIAVSPASHRNIVVAWEQDPSEKYGPLSILVAVSRDGGGSWRVVRVPRVSRCTGAETDYASDAALSIGADRVVYLSSLASSFGTFGVQVSRSTNGGLSWEKPVPVAAQHVTGGIAAAPATPGTAYLVTTASEPQGNAMFLSRTADAGRTWSAPARIQTPLGQSLVADKLFAFADGALLLVCEQLPTRVEQILNRNAPSVLVAMRSADKGKTWSSPVKLSEIPRRGFPHDPEQGEPGGEQGRILTGEVPTASAGPNGTAYVAWADVTAKDSARILLSKSADDGVTWSAPQSVVNVATQTFLPTLATTSDGTLGLTWLDFRNDKTSDTELTTDIWFAHSHDQGGTWRQTHLAGPFDMRRAPEHFGHYVGFVQGLAALRDGFGAAFIQTKPRAIEGPSDVYFARLAARRAKKKRR